MRQTIKYARARAVDVNRYGLLPVEVNGRLKYTRGVYLQGTKVRIHSTNLVWL